VASRRAPERVLGGRRKGQWGEFLRRFIEGIYILGLRKTRKVTRPFSPRGEYHRAHFIFSYYREKEETASKEGRSAKSCYLCAFGGPARDIYLTVGGSAESNSEKKIQKFSEAFNREGEGEGFFNSVEAGSPKNRHTCGVWISSIRPPVLDTKTGARSSVLDVGKKWDEKRG